jgi:hypothetical protein
VSNRRQIGGAFAEGLNSMRQSTRFKIDLLKKLLEDDSIQTEFERCRLWRTETGRSRPRYYHYLPIALQELVTEKDGQGDTWQSSLHQEEINSSALRRNQSETLKSHLTSG